MHASRTANTLLSHVAAWAPDARAAVLACYLVCLEGLSSIPAAVLACCCVYLGQSLSSATQLGHQLICASSSRALPGITMQWSCPAGGGPGSSGYDQSRGGYDQSSGGYDQSSGGQGLGGQGLGGGSGYDQGLGGGQQHGGGIRDEFSSGEASHAPPARWSSEYAVETVLGAKAPSQRAGKQQCKEKKRTHYAEKGEAASYS